MDLILWRHAEAQEPADGTNDMDRPLTPRGEKQAARMAGRLDRQLPEGTRVWVSPARRTEQTALALARKYKLRPELAPDCTVAQTAGRGPVAQRQIGRGHCGPPAGAGPNHCAPAGPE